MGDEATATRRLNFAQSFNPMGSLTGMLVARNLILCKLDPMTEDARRELLKTSPDAFTQIAKHDLSVIIGPYAVLGVVVALFFVVFLVTRLPRSTHDENRDLSVGATLKRLSKNANYIEGVVAQAFYVGVQIMCWTFIIQYAEAEMGLSKAEGQFYNMIAMGMFVCSRFICTFLLKFINSGALLAVLATLGAALILGVIFLPGMPGLYCLVAVSATMSLMFPTIYGIALEGLGDDAKLGTAGLIMAIGGGCLMPPIQGLIMDQSAFNLIFTTLSSVRMSFTLPLICFVVVALYGLKTYRRSKQGVSSC
jgi:FHS family L-fucose permease-like MFS transporter